MRGADLALELGRQLALAGDLSEHAALAIVQLGEIFAPLFDRADRNFVEALRRLFAVARDERHCRTFSQQPAHGSHGLNGELQLRGDLRSGVVRGFEFRQGLRVRSWGFFR